MADCERCRGTGFEIVLSALPDGGEVEVARRCACQQVGGAEAASRRLEALRVPPRYEHCTFANFEIGAASTPLTRQAKAAAVSYCMTYDVRASRDSHDRGLGLLFMGGNGAGKTHLAVAVLHELALTHGVRGQFWDYHELMREIRNSYNPSTAITEYEVLEPIIDLDLLLLDDLGAWRMTDWMNDTLFYILNKRYVARRPTVITTNSFDKDLRGREGADDVSVRRELSVDGIGDRLRSRLSEATTIVRLDSPDWRKVKQGWNQTLLQ